MEVKVNEFYKVKELQKKLKDYYIQKKLCKLKINK